MSVELIKQIRERSGAPIGECKKALDESNGDVEVALEILQKRGILKAGALSLKEATEGLFISYIHAGKIAVLVEVNCSTDFVARSPEFRSFAEETAMQIAATGAKHISVQDVPEIDVHRQVQIIRAQLQEEQKPERSWEKILEGRLNKWYEEVCLLNQESILYPKTTVEQLRTSLVAKLGENVKIRRFVRWELGDGVVKESKEDFATEISKLMNS